MFGEKKHNSDLYNILLFLSRNIFFYKDLSFKDTYETRIYLMFIHYSIILIILKKKGYEPDQENYNNLFHSIEYNLRELGFGDVSVNKKMKDLNKLFYDILIKLNLENDGLKLNKELFLKYFEILDTNDKIWEKCKLYFEKFYKYCFDIHPKNMIKDIEKYKF